MPTCVRAPPLPVRLPGVAQASIPFGQWGRVTARESGSFLCIERQASEEQKKPLPADAVRIWMRRPGEPDDSDFNWTTWLHEADLPQWISGYGIDEWLPPGVEPDWS